MRDLYDLHRGRAVPADVRRLLDLDFCCLFAISARLRHRQRRWSRVRRISTSCHVPRSLDNTCVFTGLHQTAARGTAFGVVNRRRLRRLGRPSPPGGNDTLGVRGWEERGDMGSGGGGEQTSGWGTGEKDGGGGSREGDRMSPERPSFRRRSLSASVWGLFG